MCEHTKKVRSSQAAIPVVNWVKQFFPVSIVNEFQKGKEYGDKGFLIPPSLFEITESFLSIEIPYCELNEIKNKTLFEEISQIH